MPSSSPSADHLARARAYPAFRDGRELCADVEPEVFFPESHSAEAAALAVMICRRCPLVEPCLRWALETRQDFGIWGAATPGERRKYLKIIKNRGPR